jgi:hypothetical protein
MCLGWPLLYEERSLTGGIMQMDDLSQRRAPPIDLGRIVGTPGAIAAVPADEMAIALNRHSNRDWGEVDADDKAENDRSAREGFRVLSAYRTSAGTKFWIITEADRSVTTILLPEEY